MFGATRLAPDEGPITVVHLVRAANGPEPFRRFLEAWRRNPCEVDHRLVLAFKGFASAAAAEPYLAEGGTLVSGALHFRDEGYDLGVYLGAAQQLRHSRYCFLNSFSEPLCAGWLAKLQAPLLSGSGVGIAGASGSWNSPRSWTLQALAWPTPYRGLLPARAEMRRAFADMDAERLASPSRSGRAGRLKGAANAARELVRCVRDYEEFPAHHVRTNAFVIAHETLASVTLWRVRRKREAYLMESGRHSLTRQVQRLGLRAVVVDRGGDVYDQDEWHRSATFWQRRQEGLMVEDNQSRVYARGGLARRGLLATMAWGAEATPLADAAG
ncbi:MAG: hypothetical protein ACYDC2_03140 [Solirubrobacteraceae bacterium]